MASVAPFDGNRVIIVQPRRKIRPINAGETFSLDRNFKKGNLFDDVWDILFRCVAEPARSWRTSDDYSCAVLFSHESQSSA